MIEFAVQGILAGVVYGLLALPITLLFSATGTVDLAVGAYAVLSGAVAFVIGGPIGMIVGVFAAVVASGVVACIAILLTERRSDHVSLVLASFAAAIFLESFILTKFGKDPFVQAGFGETISVLGLPLSTQSVLNLMIALAVTIGLSLILYRSPWGRRMRATAVNARGATLAGIAVVRVQFTTFLITGALAGLAGILVLHSGGSNFSSSLHLTLAGFSAAIIFGLSGPVHALLGGLAIGLVEGIGGGYGSGGVAAAVPLLFTFVALALAPAKLAGGRA
jgi:branched-chain amino acid transport system permease protein